MTSIDLNRQRSLLKPFRQTGYAAPRCYFSFRRKFSILARARSH